MFFKFKKNLDKNNFKSEVVFLKDDFHGKKIVLKKKKTILNRPIFQINFKKIIFDPKT